MDTPQTLISQILELSPPVVLWIVLNILMMIVKRVPGVQTWMIPATSFILGGVIYPTVSDPSKVSFAVHSPLMAQILTGLLIGGAAVGGHQLFKQYTAKIGFSFSTNGDTQMFTKPADATADVVDSTKPSNITNPKP